MLHVKCYVSYILFVAFLNMETLQSWNIAPLVMLAPDFMNNWLVSVLVINEKGVYGAKETTANQLTSNVSAAATSVILSMSVSLKPNSALFILSPVECG